MLQGRESANFCHTDIEKHTQGANFDDQIKIKCINISFQTNVCAAQKEQFYQILTALEMKKLIDINLLMRVSAS